MSRSSVQIRPAAPLGINGLKWRGSLSATGCCDSSRPLAAEMCRGAVNRRKRWSVAESAASAAARRPTHGPPVLLASVQGRIPKVLKSKQPARDEQKQTTRQDSLILFDDGFQRGKGKGICLVAESNRSTFRRTGGTACRERCAAAMQAASGFSVPRVLIQDEIGGRGFLLGDPGREASDHRAQLGPLAGLLDSIVELMGVGVAVV